MKKLLITLLIIFIFIIIVIFFLNHKISFSENVLAETDVKDITSVEITHSPGDETILINNPNEIENFISLFSGVKLKRTNFLTKPEEYDSNNIYWITIKVSGERAYMMRLDSDFYLTVTGKEKRRISDYKIVENFELAPIEKMFK